MNNAPLQDIANLKLRQNTLIDEQVRTLYKNIPLSLGVTIMLDALISASHWNVIGHGELILWNILMACAIALRIATWFVWQHTRTHLAAEYWLAVFRVGTWIAGAAWGSSAYFMYAPYNPTYEALLAFTLAGVASGSLSSLSTDKYSVIGFVSLAIVPLSIRIHLEHGPIAIPMSIMTVLFVLFVLLTAHRARQQLESHLDQHARLIEWGNDRIQQQLINRIISDAQSQFIADNTDRRVFSRLLSDIIAFTDSTMGFIAEVMFNEEQQPYLSMLALTDISWDQKSKETYAKLYTTGLRQTNLNTLFGAALTNGRPIISNTPSHDMRAAGTPPGHPAITAFMGIPIFNGAQIVGMLALANKAGGYDDRHIDTLKPILNLISQFIIAMRFHVQHMADSEKISLQAQHTQAILDEAFDAIIELDSGGIIRNFNHSAEMMFGYHADQIIGKSFNTLIAAQHNPNNDFIESHLSQGGKKILGANNALFGLRRNGKEFPIELAISEIFSGAETSYIGMVRDLSERMHNEKLKHDFIATVSHEIRTPLTSLSASLAIIESGTLGSLPEKVTSLVKIAKQNSIRLQNLISDLLDMDKLILNQLEFDIRSCDTLDIVQNAINTNHYIFDKHQVKPQITNAAIGVKVLADEMRTQQVLSHLLSNAAKFSPPFAHIDIAVTTHKNWVKFAITDYGSGIPNDFKHNIFHSFTQADASSTRSREGAGIGLAISKELIEKMGGKIGFTSNIGQGSCFFFELPAAKMPGK